VQAVGRVNGVAVRALANQETPFEDVLAALEVARDLSFQPVFQVMFIYQNWPFPVSALGAARLGRVGIHSGTAKHDLHFVLEERDGALEVCIEYATALYRAATIERFAQHFAVLLDGIVADPERRISDLPLLTSQQQQQIVAWNSTATAFPRERCLHELFAEQAARTPDAVAVACEGVSLTYAELDVRGNRLAHHLRALGVGPEVVVGLCMERSAELLVALLGILKTGGAYLPLDPAYPPERLAYMLADADVPVLVTHAALAERFPAGGATLVRLDAEAAAIASRPAPPGASGARPENLAYVIYTSGSTGRPKGVMIPHGALVNFLCSMAVEPGLGRTDVVAATTPLSFDIAGLELYLPLLCGARSVIVPRAVALDTERLCAHLAELGTTALQATPSLWRLLLESGWQPGPGLKLLCGGEALPAEVAARLAAAPGGAWNLYGPTETTIWSAACRLLPGTGVSIGRPIANTQLYVLDAALQPVPVGVAGEICIGGAGLARGYFGRPGLTAERFVPSPFALGERLYRTGDVARWQPDGTIEFLGRADHQVKLRGHRVELGEIETVLAQIGGVEQAVVTAREAKSGDMRLVAYVVGANLPGASSLRAALRDLLPDHMIPSAFVALPVLPLTPNGKVDRKLLPEPVEAARAPFAAPRQAVPAEAELAALWAEVLGTERVGIDDNFFELGGHSLLLLRVHGKLAGSLGRSLPVSALFQYPTIRALAAHLAGAGEQSDPLGASQVRAAARKAALDRRRRPQPAAQAAEEEISSHV
ncbi:MAG: hypothetical protein QOI11_2530, partial [Candidatus Eremiobacteraeota bacterium]|jgi:amino acid adenylation domain-containing protein|nr:hypothetical protein [Candidatus Eremiobacteraeota bacterium]